MNTTPKTQQTSLILLAGGKGTRLQAVVSDVPKPLAPVGGRPFLEWQLRYWARYGATDVILSAGHLAEVVDRFAAGRDGVRVVREPEPMGTGGAIRYCARQVRLSDPFLVANADSLVIADLAGFLDCPEPIDGKLLAIEVEDASRFGTVEVDPAGLLRGFREKRPGRGWINGGVYLFRRSLLDRFPDRTPLSIETEVFPHLLESGAKLQVVEQQADFLDIGTPESFARGEAFVARHFSRH